MASRYVGRRRCTASGKSSDHGSWRVSEWKLWHNSRLSILLVITVVFGGILVLAGALLTLAADRTDIAVFAALSGFGVAFEEIERRVAKYAQRIRVDHFIGMAQVWALAAVVSLPASLAIVQVATFRLYLWLRNERGNASPHRRLYSAAVALLATLAATDAMAMVSTSLQWAPPTVADAAAYAAAAVTYTVLNVLAIAAAVRLAAGAPVPLSKMIGTLDDNLIEIATLALGVLVGVAALTNPWLVAFVLPVAVVLQRATLVGHLERQASTDSKTGLLNAATWHRVGVSEIARAERDRHAVAVLIFDLDNFKAVNDSWGHLVGDQAIVAVADLLRSELRDYDSVGRFGGEEFVALLPQATPAEALIVAERIRGKVCQISLETDRQPGPALSVSAGLACFPEHGRSMDILLQAADSALFAAKNGGRNQVAVSSTRATSAPWPADTERSHARRTDGRHPAP